MEDDYRSPGHFDDAGTNPYSNHDPRKETWDKEIRTRDGFREFNAQTSRMMDGGISAAGWSKLAKWLLAMFIGRRLWSTSPIWVKLYRSLFGKR